MAADTDPNASTSGSRSATWWIANAVALAALVFMVLSLQSCARPSSGPLSPPQVSQSPSLVDHPLPSPELRVGKNSRYFVDGAGRPFFWMADTAWGLPINLTRDAVVTYLDIRQSQGFNVIQTVGIFNQAGGPGPNRFGIGRTTGPN